MKTLLKHIFSFILPVTVLILVPLCIEPNIKVHQASIFLAGLLIIAVGLLILVATIISFIRIGKGTLAPWSPTRKLIIDGMYSYVRNPMILGVLIVLLGESVTLLSLNILIWALIFFIINNIWFIFYEEPELERKFGNEYREYKKKVPRWIPKLKPFIPESEKSS